MKLIWLYIKDLRLNLHELSAGLHDSMPGEKTTSKQSTISEYSVCKATGKIVLFITFPAKVYEKIHVC